MCWQLPTGRKSLNFSCKTRIKLKFNNLYLILVSSCPNLSKRALCSRPRSKASESPMKAKGIKSWLWGMTVGREGSMRTTRSASYGMIFLKFSPWSTRLWSSWSRLRKIRPQNSPKDSWTQLRISRQWSLRTSRTSSETPGRKPRHVTTSNKSCTRSPEASGSKLQPSNSTQCSTGHLNNCRMSFWSSRIKRPTKSWSSTCIRRSRKEIHKSQRTVWRICWEISLRCTIWSHRVLRKMTMSDCQCTRYWSEWDCPTRRTSPWKSHNS